MNITPGVLEDLSFTQREDSHWYSQPRIEKYHNGHTEWHVVVLGLDDPMRDVEIRSQCFYDGTTNDVSQEKPDAVALPGDFDIIGLILLMGIVGVPKALPAKAGEQ